MLEWLTNIIIYYYYYCIISYITGSKMGNLWCNVYIMCMCAYNYDICYIGTFIFGVHSCKCLTLNGNVHK